MPCRHFLEISTNEVSVSIVLLSGDADTGKSEAGEQPVVEETKRAVAERVVQVECGIGKWRRVLRVDLLDQEV